MNERRFLDATFSKPVSYYDEESQCYTDIKGLSIYGTDDEVIERVIELCNSSDNSVKIRSKGRKKGLKIIEVKIIEGTPNITRFEIKGCETDDSK